MAKKKQEKQKAYFKESGNLPSGEPFEKGAEVPADLPDKDLQSLIDNEAIEIK